MRFNGISLTQRLRAMAPSSRWAGLPLSAVAVLASAWAVPARPGTELGNARFVPYANDQLGIAFRYPEVWNVIDSGNAVSIVDATGFRPAAEALSAHDSVSFEFDDRVSFATPIAFERYVRRTRPESEWRPASFRGRPAYQTLSPGKLRLVVMKDSFTTMEIAYDVDANGRPSAWVERTVATFEFR